MGPVWVAPSCRLRGVLLSRLGGRWQGQAGQPAGAWCVCVDVARGTQVLGERHRVGSREGPFSAALPGHQPHPLLAATARMAGRCVLTVQVAAFSPAFQGRWDSICAGRREGMRHYRKAA